MGALKKMSFAVHELNLFKSTPESDTSVELLTELANPRSLIKGCSHTNSRVQQLKGL